MISKKHWVFRGMLIGGQATIIGIFIFYLLSLISVTAKTNWLEFSIYTIWQISFGAMVLAIFVIIPSLIITLIPNLMGGILLAYIIKSVGKKLPLLYGVLLGIGIGVFIALILSFFVGYLFDFEWFKKGEIEAIRGFVSWIITALLSAALSGGYAGYKLTIFAMPDEQKNHFSASTTH